MRRPSGSRASAAVAVVAVIVAVLAVMFPGLGFGESRTSHGLTPTDVFTTTQDPESETCGEADTFGTPPIMPTQVSVAATSNLLVYFTSEWVGAATDTELLLIFTVKDAHGNVVGGAPQGEWGLTNNPRTHDSGTVMWSFDDVQPGVYQVFVDARTDPVPGPAGGGNTHNNPHATLDECALTVFVIPAA